MSMSTTMMCMAGAATFSAAAPAAFQPAAVGEPTAGARMTSKPVSKASTTSTRPSPLISARATSLAPVASVVSSVKMMPWVAVGVPVGAMPEVARPGLSQIAGGLPMSARTRSASPSASMSSALIACAPGTSRSEPGVAPSPEASASGRPSAWTDSGLAHQPFKALPSSSATRPLPGLYSTKMLPFAFVPAAPEPGWLTTRSLSPSPSMSTPTMDVGAVR